MNAKLLTICTAAILLVGCVNKAPKPDNPYFAPVEPSAYQPVVPVNGSLFSTSTAMNLYGDGRAFRVGDIISVQLEERTQSSKSASTSADKSSNVAIDGGTAFGQDLAVGKFPLSANFGGNSGFSGDGSSDMSNSLSGQITATVHEVRPNGTLLVRGEKWLTLNQGDEYIRVSGIVRPQDIDASNTISSTRLADARITYSGTGSVHDTNSMGWLAKFFISPMWFL
jgi:flagellar L-ring protein precursor FlgH